MKRLALIFLLCVLTTFNAYGDFEDGNALYSSLKTCELQNVDISCLHATGYIIGASDTRDMFTRTFGIKNAVCAPNENISRNQLKDIVFLYLKNNPVERSKSASSIVFAALMEAWPCPEE